jgi:energy-coupling factor transporter ATP-binding protein EcfA2
MTHLIGLRVENYGPISLIDVAFDPKGGVVAIMGQNEAGKSHLIDAFEALVAPKGGAPKKAPIKLGAEEAVIVGTFDNLIIRRVYKANGTTQFTATGTKDGRKYDSNSDVLKALYEHISFDPFAFSKLRDDEQVNMLLPLIGVDPKPFDDAYMTAYALRTPATVKKDSLAGRLAALPPDTPGLPAELVSVADLSAELSRALSHNADRAAVETNLEASKFAVNRYAISISDAQAEVDRARAELNRQETRLEEANRQYAEAIEKAEAIEAELTTEAMVRIDTAPIQARIDSAEVVNDQIRARGSRATLAAEAKTAREEWETLNKQVEKARTDKAAALAAAKMPVPNLAIDPETNLLMLNGLPFSAASTAVKIRTGVAIAMAQNPELRAMAIRDASLLDEKNQKVIDELAIANELTVLMEIAGEGEHDGPAIVIEAGAVKEIRS